MKDADILKSFQSLHEAMTMGFDRAREDLEREIGGVRGEIVGLRNELGGQIQDVRNDIARVEQRVLRRFDERDARLENHERRITALEGPK